MDPSIFTALSLQPTGTMPIHTPSTAGKPHQCNLYDVAIAIPGLHQGSVAHVMQAMPVFESEFKAQGIDGLLGRDILASAIMHYNGAEAGITISF